MPTSRLKHFLVKPRSNNLKTSTSNPSPEHVEITYGVSAVLEAEGQWSKQFVLTSEKTENTPEIKETYQLNLTEIEELIKTIEKETDTRTSTHYYKIVPKIHLNSSTAGESIIEEYTPTLQIKLAPTILEFTGLSHTKPESIGTTKHIKPHGASLASPQP